jgi:putative spermidine/putrescine transport system permease protein
MDPALEEAAMSLGANRVRAFLRVTLPLLRSALFSGAVFAFIISLGDINLALFLSGPTSTTLPVHLYSTILWGGDPTIAAASALQILVVGGLIFVVQRFLKIRLVL